MLMLPENLLSKQSNRIIVLEDIDVFFLVDLSLPLSNDLGSGILNIEYRIKILSF